MSVIFKHSKLPITNELAPNLTASFKDCHISYARYLSYYGSDTTALVIKQRVFLILNGDHSQQMGEAAKKGIHSVFDYFIEHIEEANPLSEHLSAASLVDDPFNLSISFIEIFGEEGATQIKKALKIK